MKRLIEFINEAAISKKATPLMKEICTYFKGLDANTCVRNDRTNNFYDYITNNCEKVELNDKDFKKQAVVIFMRSNKDKEESYNKYNVLEVIFVRPVEKQKMWDDKSEIDAIGFCGFVDSSIYYPQSFSKLSKLKSFYKEFKRGQQIEIYKVENTDAFSSFPKSSLEDALGGQSY